MVKAQTLKGFRDFLPNEARKRQYVINKLKSVFESFGFEPLETPALEYEEVLLGKYGEEGDKLMYRFEDNGGRKVALRYDQTVQLARVVAQYQNQLPMPFKRYQIQPVWRAENTQKGRFREFLQCDADIVGIDSALSDAEVISVCIDALQNLGFTNFKIILNDRKVFEGVQKEVIVAVDKIKKIGREGVISELVKKKVSPSTQKADSMLQDLEKTLPSERIKRILSYFEDFGEGTSRCEFSPTLARGLDYYTGLIFEAEIEGYSAGSVAGGGRYDDLIGMFLDRTVPAVGFAFGFDRLIEAMEQLNLFPKDILASKSKILITIFNPELVDKSLEAASLLDRNNISYEIYLDENAKLEKQLKYADQKGIPFAVIIGPEEAESRKVVLKDLKKRTQETLSLDEATQKLT